MSRSRWLIVGLVVAALLVVAGFLGGHVASTRSAGELAEARQRADSLLGDARRDHQRAIDSLAALARADSLEAARLERIAAQRAGEVARWRAEADTLTALVLVAETARDSLALYPALVASLDSALVVSEQRADALESALRVTRSELAAWRQVAARGSERITQLEGVIADLRRPERWSLRLLGVRVAPGVGAGLTTTGEVGLVAGIVVSR